MSRTIYLDEQCYQAIEEARVTDKGLIPKVQALRNLLGVKREHRKTTEEWEQVL